MNIDRTHLRWIAATFLLTVAATVYHFWSRSIILFGFVSAALMLFAGLLPLGKKLRILNLRTMQRGHIWLGLLSLPLILMHSQFRFGGILSTILLALFLTIIVSGILGLYLQHLLVLCKEGKAGKGKVAARLISTGHQITLLSHVPLSASLLVLGIAHAIASLYF